MSKLSTSFFRKMDSIEFACLLHKIQKNLKVDIDSDVICMIYEDYDNRYNNYTLLELIYELYLARRQITSRWNKKELIQLIKELWIDIPLKNTPLQSNIWQCHKKTIADDVYSYYIYVYDCSFEFQDGDIIQMEDSKIYTIEIELVEEIITDYNEIIYTDLVYVHLSDINTVEKITMTGEKFMNIVDNEDITILKNTDKVYYAY